MSACSVQRAANNSPLIETLRLPAQVQVACPLSLRMCLHPMKTTYFADVAKLLMMSFVMPASLRISSPFFWGGGCRSNCLWSYY